MKLEECRVGGGRWWRRCRCRCGVMSGRPAALIQCVLSSPWEMKNKWRSLWHRGAGAYKGGVTVSTEIAMRANDEGKRGVPRQWGEVVIHGCGDGISGIHR